MPKFARLMKLKTSMRNVRFWLLLIANFLMMAKSRSSRLPARKLFRPILPSWPTGANKLAVFVVVSCKGC